MNSQDDIKIKMEARLKSRERDRNLMKFLRFRRPTPARLTRNEEDEVRTHLYFRQLLLGRRLENNIFTYHSVLLES